MAYITVGSGEGAYQVWVDDPVPAKSDPELPQPDPPPPAPTATSTTASNNAATTGNGTSTPAGNQSTPTATSDTVDLTAQIRGELGAGPKNNQGYLNLILNKYSAADLAKAYPEFGNERDYQVAKDGLPKGLIVPGSLDAEGRIQAVRGTPEFIRAEQLANQGGREAIRKAAIANGFPADAAIPTSSSNGRIYITLQSGKDIDITSYFDNTALSPVAIGLDVPTYGTSTVTTPFRKVTVTALPEVARTVSTSEGSIVVDANSEVARQIQWRGSQPGLDGRPIRESWARAGISDPYSNPAIVGQAIASIERAEGRTALFNQNGVTPPGSQIAPWNDPNWPAYQGSNKAAYELASAALADPNVRNNLMAQYGWNLTNFENWALSSTNPDEAARLAKIRDEAAGLVAGPGRFVIGGSAGTAGTTTGLSPNGATVVTTSGSSVNSQGFANATFGQVSALSNFNPAEDAAYLALFPPTTFSGTTLVSSTGGPISAATDPAAAAAQIAQFNPSQAAGNSISAPADVSQNPYRQSPTTSAPVNTAPQAQTVPTSGSSSAVPLAIAAAAAVAASALSTGTQTTPVLPVTEPVRVSDPYPPPFPSIQPRISAESEAAVEAAARENARNQATLQARYKQPASADWRVRLQLAPNADYLYKDRSVDTILAPLYETDGVIFPYTPSIETTYNANYEMYDLTHSNFRGYFYKNSRVNDINIRATFTAQDTQEANYLLAVIHFFRSVTKMFYGAKDKLRGAPPPLTYLSGLGQYQFNQHPCVVSQFNYSLPNDVDYIRAGAPNNYGTNLLTQRARTGAIAPEAGDPSGTRRVNSGLSLGGLPQTPSPSMINQNVNNLAQATYVPTKIEISLTLLPINTRSQVSTQFNMQDFASGALIKGGFW